MPTLPSIPKTTEVKDIGSEEHALAVARVLSGTSKREDTSRFMAVIRRYFREDKAARKDFTNWYESVPSTDDEEDRPKKKKKKHAEEEE